MWERREKRRQKLHMTQAITRWEITLSEIYLFSKKPLHVFLSLTILLILLKDKLNTNMRTLNNQFLSSVCEAMLVRFVVDHFSSITPKTHILLFKYNIKASKEMFLLFHPVSTYLWKRLTKQLKKNSCRFRYIQVDPIILKTQYARCTRRSFSFQHYSDQTRCISMQELKFG